MTTPLRPDVPRAVLQAPVVVSDTPALQVAVLRTLAYADVFDFALSHQELHRYLIGVRAAPMQVTAAVASLDGRVVQRDGLVALAGREWLFTERVERRRIAARTWPTALRYARAVGSLPFVRMVAITGALAVGNATEGGDLDLFVVTERGRLWLTRASAILLVRYAARRGHELCPNYFLAEHVLELGVSDLYRAHELAQMVPVTGAAIYRRLRAANGWSTAHLPNAAGAPLDGRARRSVVLRRARPFAEGMLRTPFWDAAETWEQRRKIARFGAEATARGVSGEASFSPDWCKGHLDGHAAHIRVAYEARARELGVEPLW